MKDFVKILIVDDQKSNIDALVEALEPLNLDMTTVLSSRQALKIIKQAQGDFAVMLLDVQMPDMDGFELAQNINHLELKNKPPIIFLTAIFKDEEHIHTGYYSGAVDYLAKPININILRAKIAVFVEIYIQNKKNIQLATELAETIKKLEVANESLSSFAYVVSHDLKAPIRHMNAFMDALEEQKDETNIPLSPQVIDTYFVRIRGCTDRMSRIIDDILDFAKYGLSKASCKNVMFSALVDKAKASLLPDIENHGAEIIIEGDAEIFVDSIKMSLVIQNLIQNALKYRDLARTPRIFLAIADENESFTIRVVDNGQGIATEFHKVIFGFMKRLHREDDIPGTGIGLSTCQKIVESHQGRIWVESKPGEGAAFMISLPKLNRDG